MKRRVSAWLAAIASALALALVGVLAGCAMIGEPTSTESLLVRFAAQPDNANFSARVHVGCAVRFASSRLTVPIDASARTAGGSATGTATAGLTALGETDPRQYEFCGELSDNRVTWYLHDAGAPDKPWERSEIEVSCKLDIPLVVELLSDARFLRVAYDEEPEVRYELVVPAASIVQAVLDKGEVSTSFGKVDEAAVLEAIGESKLHVRFDERCLVRSVHISLGFSYEDKELLPVPADVNLDFVLTADAYGEVDAAQAQVPDAVRDGAVATDDPLGMRDIAAKL